MTPRETLSTLARDLAAAEDGVSLVEFTLVMPLLFSLLAGFLEFGRVIQHHQVIEKQMRAAARYLARVPDIGQSGDGTCVATPGSAADAARSLALYGTLSDGTTPLIAYWDDPASVCIEGPEAVDVTDEAGTTFTVDTVAVETAVAYQDLGFLSLLGLGDTITLRARHEEPYIGE